jgi:hypothetical protein
MTREARAAAATALLGVALSVPSVIAPTWTQTVGDRQRGDLLSGQAQWSWGRVELTGLTGVELEVVPNPIGLALAVALLMVGLAGVGVWLLSRGRRVVVAPILLALLAARLLTTAAERHGRVFREEIASEAGLTVTNGTTTAGWLETAAALVLVVALVLMARILMARVLMAERGPRGQRAAEDLEDGAGVDGPAARHTGMEASRPGLRPKGAHLEAPEVGLTDDKEGR